MWAPKTFFQKIEKTGDDVIFSVLVLVSKKFCGLGLGLGLGQVGLYYSPDFCVYAVFLGRHDTSE